MLDPQLNVQQLAEKIAQSGSIRFDESYVDSILEAVHSELSSNWNDEHDVSIAVLRHTVDEVSADVLLSSFSELTGPTAIRRLLLLPFALERKSPPPRAFLKFDRLFSEHDTNRLGHGYFEAMKAWSARFPEEARALLFASISDDDPARDVVSRRRLPLLIMEGLARGALNNPRCNSALTECVRVMRQGPTTSQATVVFSVPARLRGGVISSSEAQAEILAASNSAEEELRIAALSSLRLLNEKRLPNCVREAIKSASTDERQTVKSAALSAIQPIEDSEDHLDQELVREVLGEFENCDVSDDGLAFQLSWCLYAVARIQPKVVLGFLRSWAKRAEQSKPLTHSTRFLHVIQSLDPQFITDAVLHWIVEDSSLVRVAMDLIRESGKACFSDSALQVLSAREIEIALLALAADDHDEHAAQLTLCIATFVLRSTSLSGELQQQAAGLMTHAISNYAGNVESLTKALKAMRLRRVNALLTKITGLQRARMEAWNAASTMHEFRPSAAREMTYRKFDEHFQRLIHSSKPDDPGRYVFSSLFAEVTLLGGSSTLQRTDDGWIRVPLSTVIAHAELPRFAILDEEAEFIRRVHLKQRAEVLRGGEE